MKIGIVAHLKRYWLVVDGKKTANWETLARMPSGRGNDSLLPLQEEGAVVARERGDIKRATTPNGGRGNCATYRVWRKTSECLPYSDCSIMSASPCGTARDRNKSRFSSFFLKGIWKPEFVNRYLGPRHLGTNVLSILGHRCERCVYRARRPRRQRRWSALYRVNRCRR